MGPGCGGRSAPFYLWRQLAPEILRDPAGDRFALLAALRDTIAADRGRRPRSGAQRVTGALLGWAEHLRRTGGRRGWRWLVLAPLAFVAATPGVLVSVFTEGGIGGGAIAVPLFAMAGGYALSGRGRAWTMAVAGLIAPVPIVGWTVAAATIGAGLGLASPRRA